MPLQKMKLDQLKEMGLTPEMADDLDHAEIIRILQLLKLGVPDLPCLRQHTVPSLPNLNEDIARQALNAALSIANRLDEPVRR